MRISGNLAPAVNVTFTVLPLATAAVMFFA